MKHIILDNESQVFQLVKIHKTIKVWLKAKPTVFI